jgi:hypothetical protein
MCYKFGIEKVGLRAGKMLGMAAGLLLFFQLPLAGRLKMLDRIFSMAGLIPQYRIHAWAIALMALIHPACVLFSEGIIIIPLEMRYWTEEMVGWLHKANPFRLEADFSHLIDGRVLAGLAYPDKKSDLPSPAKMPPHPPYPPGVFLKTG